MLLENVSEEADKWDNGIIKRIQEVVGGELALLSNQEPLGVQTASTLAVLGSCCLLGAPEDVGHVTENPG